VFCASSDDPSRHDDLNGVSESVDREIPAIDRQDLVDSRISVDDGEDNRVHKRERLINVLGKYGSGLLVGPLTRWPHLKHFRRVVNQPEDRQGDTGVLPRTHPSVVSKLGKGLANDEIRNCDLRLLSPSGDNLACCPGMKSVPSIDCCNQRPLSARTASAVHHLIDRG
jgi:hypothetical protein